MQKELALNQVDFWDKESACPLSLEEGESRKEVREN